jgi:hypothetical protein
MGRGNKRLNDNEATYYVEYDEFNTYVLDEDGNETQEVDYEMQGELVGDFLANLKTSSILSMHFIPFTKWLHDSEMQVIFHNDHYAIVTFDNEWSIGFGLMRKDFDDIYHYYDFESEEKEAAARKLFNETQDGLFDKYNEALQDALYEYVMMLYVPNGPWMSKTIEKRRVEYCVMDKGNNNIDCYPNFESALTFANINKEAQTIKRVRYAKPDENKDEAELSAETIWEK